MTLGFLAFCIFLFNSFGGFEWCVGNAHDHGIDLPHTSDDWLHIAEAVHMQLFLGMIIYFAIISRALRGSMVMIQKWERPGLPSLSRLLCIARSFGGPQASSWDVTPEASCMSAREVVHCHTSR